VNNFDEKASFIWSVADLIRDTFKRSKYQDVVLPFTVLSTLTRVLDLREITMTKNALRLVVIVLLVSLFSPGKIFAQSELRVVQGHQNYYDGVLTSLKPINAADAEVIFVNGILTDAQGHEDGLESVSDVFPGLDVIGVYNATDEILSTIDPVDTLQRFPLDSAQGLDDLRQGLGLGRLLTETNPAVDTLLTYLLLYDHEVTLVAHSQGAAIASAALRTFSIRYPERLDRLSRVNVITLGGFAISFPEGPRYWHVVFTSDPVPVAAIALSWGSLMDTPWNEEKQAAWRDFAGPGYVQALIQENDGPAPLLVDVRLEDFVFLLPDWQHGLEAYLKVLPLDALPRARPTSTVLAPGLGAIHEVAWSEGGQTLALATDRGIGLYQIDNLDAGPHLLASAEPVLSVAWEPIYGFILASTGKDMTVRVWNANSEEEGGIWHIGVHWGSSVAWSPDGTVRTGGARLAFAGYDNIWVSDPQNPAELTGLLSGPGGVWANSVAWSPDGTRLASGHADAMIRMWTAQPGETPVVFQGHVYEGFGGVLSVAWSPDSRKLVSGGEDGTVRLWDADTGTTLAVLQEHVGLVNSVAWSPDGTRLASGGADGTVRLWNAQTGELLDVLQGHTDQVNSVAWSPDGTRLASGSTDGTVRLWNVPGS